MRNPNQARQGDVFLERIEEPAPHGKPIPRDQQGRIILAEGEVTGHAHAVLDRSAQLLDGPSAVAAAQRILLAPQGATVVHEEHGPVPLGPGVHRVTRQREWTDGDESVNVAD